MTLKPNWEYVADRVMGGVSNGTLQSDAVDGHSAMRLTGRVSLDNNGGFIQMAFDVNHPIAPDLIGIAFETIGNGERYDLRLRTTDMTRPWQSFRTEFAAPPRWETVQLPFSAFSPHRTDVPLVISRIRRIGILAIGREFDADVAVRDIRFY